GKTVIEAERRLIDNLESPKLNEEIGDQDAAQLREDVELIHGVYDDFEREEYLAGRTAPVFFGSALNNFGVRELLETFVKISPAPIPRPATTREVQPEESSFSGFIFKIHANLDPRHRDRIAFLRVCSGRFERSKAFLHVRTGKQMRFSTPYSFMAQKKEIIDEAFPGDVVGLYDRGDLKIGDTLTEGEQFTFTGIPVFSPAIFKELINTDPMRDKQLRKGIQQLTEEGVAQLFTQRIGNRLIVGTVGDLQFEVIQHRLSAEYNASCRLKPLSYHKACWITAENAKDLDAFMQYREAQIAWDKDKRPVYLAESGWMLQSIIADNPKISFRFSSEIAAS
ncbi:MAG: peptide chain release factor 3, partial [Spirochaetaceae bacterium]